MADKRISQLVDRGTVANNDVVPIVANGAATTNKATISSIQAFMQGNLDLGVTSVGITLGSTGTDVSVSGSPITTSGNITINIPTASATNRGLLSSANWTTFNGKQNSITLTTTGTGGAATLVGSTLNIPNYTTGIQNAYVPYVGAIGSVSLGYNALSASQINIDGNSPTGGSYLGFKQSTSVNTGTDGYTSMYAFGTNTIGFQSTSGGTSKTFAFSMVGITAGVPGGRQYTLPDASGTLALTSDLTGFVTLGTAQTITATKTFTTSGSGNTINVNHTSGSGHGVEITKAGNGEGLRVIKTSGGGDAVTITGGRLTAEVGLFTSTLSTNTGGHFISLNANLGGATNRIESSARPLEIVTAGSAITLAAGGATPQFTLASSGAVTLTGALNGTSASFVSSGSTNLAVERTGNNGVFMQLKDGSGNSVFLGANNGDFQVQTPSGGFSNKLVIANSGAATFSSSVNVGGTSANTDFRVYRTVDPSAHLFITAPGGDPLTSIIGISGTNVMSLRANGNVGIGTATPAVALDLGSTTGKAIHVFTSGVDYYGMNMVAYDGGPFSTNIFSGDGGAIKFRTNSGSSSQLTRMTITSTGNVGIGTATPAAILHTLTSSPNGGIIATTSATTLFTEYRTNTSTTVGFIGNGNGLVTGGGNGNFGIRAEDNLLFAAGGNAERMRITSAGAVQVGAATNGRLGVRGFTNDSSAFAFEAANSSGNTLLAIRNDGLTYTGTSTLSPYNNSTTGRAMVIESSGILGYLVSTRESKANIESIKNIDFISQLNPVQFNYRKKDSQSNEFTDELYENINYGFIADEVERVNKELVFYNEDGTLAGVEYNNMIAILTKAIQELKTEIDSLKNQIK